MPKSHTHTHLHDDLDEVLFPELLLGPGDEVVAHLDDAQGGQVVGGEQVQSAGGLAA